MKGSKKASDKDPSARLSGTYALPQATITGEVDVVKFSFAKASILSKFGPVVVGGDSHIENKNGFQLKNFSFGAGYSLPKALFVGVRVCDKISDLGASFLYTVNKDVTVAGTISYPAKSLALGSAYKCNPNTALKFKIATDGKIAASAKQTLDSSTTVAAAVGLDVTKLGDYKFGVTVILEHCC